MAGKDKTLREEAREHTNKAQGSKQGGVGKNNKEGGPRGCAGRRGGLPPRHRGSGPRGIRGYRKGEEGRGPLGRAFGRNGPSGLRGIPAGKRGKPALSGAGTDSPYPQQFTFDGTRPCYGYVWLRVRSPLDGNGAPTPYLLPRDGDGSTRNKSWMYVITTVHKSETGRQTNMHKACPNPNTPPNKHRIPGPR